jgi:hypothetical protein
MADNVDNVEKSESLVKSFDWKEFKYEKILSNNSTRKLIAILGNINEEPAVVILEKLAFTEELFTSDQEDENLLMSAEIENIFKNDIYENNFCVVNSKLNSKIFPITNISFQLDVNFF